MLDEAIRARTLRGQPIDSCPVFDVHGHIGASRDSLVGEIMDSNCDEKFNSVYVNLEQQRGISWPRALPLLMEAMNLTGINRMVFSHLDAITARTTDIYFKAHREAEEAIWFTEKRLLGYVVYAPHFVESSLTQLKRLKESSSGFVGVKLHCEVHDVRISDERFNGLFEHLKDYPCPVLIHAHPLDTPLEIARRAKSVPDTTFIMAHFWPGEHMAKFLTQECPNVCIDICASKTPLGQLERMVELVGSSRLLYGSDATYLSLGAQLAKVTLADLTQAEKEAILFQNASHIFSEYLTR
ncbi:MAG: amidohydrolase family protein [Puniceicoccaceae bacterium]